MMIHVVVFTLTTYIKQKVCQYRSNTRKNIGERSAKVENANYLTNNINNYTCFVQKMIKKFFRNNIFFRFNTPKGT